MHAFFQDPSLLALAASIAVLAGVVKGLVGFAMPMILISGLSSLLPPDQALGALILPTLVTNGMQALRQGGAAAMGSIKRFRWFLIAGFVTLLASAQLVAVLPAQAMLAGIGFPIVFFGLIQLAGWRPRLTARNKRIEIGVGAFSGLIGGVSGIWGPPTVLFLTALGTEKRDQMRVQGVIYGLGAVALTLAHLGSGVLNAGTATLSAMLIPPAVLGMWLGGKVQDRIDQNAFRKATLFVLVIAGLNLLRRAFL